MHCSLRLTLPHLLLTILIWAISSSFACPRVVSLAPSVAETIEYLGKGECIIATTVYTKDKRVKIGGIIDPDVERIIELKPDVVIATTMTPSRVIKAIESAGIRVVVVRAESIEDIERNIKIIGEIIRAENIDDRVKEFRKALSFRNKSRREKALIIVGCNSMVVAGRGTYLSQIFERYGFQNIALREGWYRINLEYIYEAKPEYIFTFCKLNVKFPFDVKIIKLSKERFLHPSPVLIEAVRELEVVIR